MVKGLLHIAEAKDEVIKYVQQTRTTQCGKKLPTTTVWGWQDYFKRALG